MMVNSMWLSGEYMVIIRLIHGYYMANNPKLMRYFMEDPHGHCAPKSWTLPQMAHLEQPFSWMILGLPLPRNTHINLVGGIPAPLKNDGVSSSVGSILFIPNCFWKVKTDSMVPFTTNQLIKGTY